MVGRLTQSVSLVPLAEIEVEAHIHQVKDLTSSHPLALNAMLSSINVNKFQFQFLFDCSSEAFCVTWTDHLPQLDAHDDCWGSLP